MTKESDYGQFYFANLGYNFRHIKTGLIITKAEYFRRYGPKEKEAWELVPFEPLNGWPSEQERTDHFKQVIDLRKEYQVKRASGMIPEGRKIYKSS